MLEGSAGSGSGSASCSQTCTPSACSRSRSYRRGQRTDRLGTLGTSSPSRLPQSGACISCAGFGTTFSPAGGTRKMTMASHHNITRCVGV